VTERPVNNKMESFLIFLIFIKVKKLKARRDLALEDSSLACILKFNKVLTSNLIQTASRCAGRQPKFFLEKIFKIVA